jgi:hypothetical protein
VYRYSIGHCVVITLIGTFLLPSNAALSKNNPAQAAAANAQAEQARQQQVMLQQQQMRQAQVQQAALHQQQARQLQEQEMKVQQEARNSQEQALKAQEEQARNNQQQAIKAQQEEARKIQEQQASNLQKQEEQRAQAQAEGARQQQKAQQDQLKAQQKLVNAQQREQQKAQRQPNPATAEMSRAGGEVRAPQSVAAIPTEGNRATFRPAQARPVPTEHIIPMKKGMSMPVLDENVAAGEKEHAQVVIQNLAPTKAMWMNNYTNNYWTSINNQRFAINRQNTYINSVLPADYPYWYQPEPGWQFSNGFVLGNMIRANLDWLRWGWHPYYGPQPEGFVCADDYIPTAWMYVPAYGLWMQPGVYGWAPAGPPYDYTGPITVEVLEPRHVHIKDPYTGSEHGRVTNVIYLYNAFFYPEDERWGYVNRHGYFIWLNL